MAVRRLAALGVLVSSSLVSACGWDGPSPGVRAAPPETTAAPSAAAIVGETDREVGAPSAEIEAAGAVGSVPVTTALGEFDLVERATTVAVVGDSLTLAATAEIEGALEQIGMQVVAIDGAENRRMVGGTVEPGTDAVDAIVAGAERPDLWVIALGTNDVGAERRGEAFRADIDAVLARLPPGAPVVWVDLWIRDRAEAVDDANLTIRAVIEARTGSAVAAWHPNGDDPGVVTEDGVHLTRAGRLRFAASIAATVGELIEPP